MAENSSAARLQMVNSQLRASDVNDLELLAAFAAVPREDYVAATQRALAYADGEIASAAPAGRKLLSPRTLGLLLKTAAPAKGERALVVGGGAGYCAAILKTLGLDVVSLETVAAPVAGVVSVEGPLNEPPADTAPFDLIVINGAFEVAPDKLIGALKDGGRLVGLDARSNPKRIVIFERFGSAVSARETYDAAGEVLPGFAEAPAFAF